MSKEFDEKREKLKRLEETIIPSLETSIADGERDKSILSKLVSIDEAHEMYLRGDATQEEYENYVRDRGALEVSVRWLPKYYAQLDTMKQEADRLKSVIKDLEQQEKKESRNNLGIDEKIQIAVGKTVLCIFGTIAGYILFSVSYEILNNIIDLIAQIPFLRIILYWPSDISMAKIVLPTMSSVMVGAWVCVKICGGAKLFSALIVLLYISSMIIWFVSYGFSLKMLFTFGMFIISACLTFNLKRSDT